MNITNILRASSVKRWHTVNTSKVQTLADHTFNVTMMARDICRRLVMDDVIVIKLAMEHDLDEVVYGDMPTPGKVLAGVTFPYNGKGCNLNVCVEIVKLCDLCDAFLFISEYHTDRLGKSSAESLLMQLTLKIGDVRTRYPCVSDAVEQMLHEIKTSPFEGHDYVGE